MGEEETDDKPVSAETEVSEVKESETVEESTEEQEVLQMDEKKGELEETMSDDVPEGFDESAARQILHEQRQGVVWDAKETEILERLSEYEEAAAATREEARGDEKEPLMKEDMISDIQERLDASKRQLTEVRNVGGGFDATEARILAEMSQMQEKWEEQKAQMMEDLSQQMQSWDQKGTQLREDLMSQLQEGIDERHERQSQMKERFDKK